MDPQEEEFLRDLAERSVKTEFRQQQMIASVMTWMQRASCEYIAANDAVQEMSIPQGVKQRPEPTNWVFRGHQPQRRLSLIDVVLGWFVPRTDNGRDADPLPGLIDAHGQGICEDGRRVLVKNGNAPFDEFGSAHIIIRGPLEVPAGREFEARIPV